ncbi:MAG: hypothetical protein E6R03_05705 [Hyphomicrobiaceae bacterium]|nr:MAG: hypothetical protein E6R03_05705 [Hyphomicrobiaceae bacterium]
MLEQKIEELTAAVATLTDVIRNAGIGQVSTSASAEPEDKPKRTRKGKETQEPAQPVSPPAKSMFDTDASEPVTEDAGPAAEPVDEFDFSGEQDVVVEEEVTIDTLRLAIRDAIAKGGKEQEADYRKKVGAVLAGFKVKTLPELAESEYAEVLAKLRAIK